MMMTMYRQYITTGTSKGNNMSIENDLTGMLFDNMSLMKKFNKDTYADAFNTYYENYKPLFDSIEKNCKDADDRDSYLRDLAASFVNRAVSEEESIEKKSDREHFIIDHNSVLAVYVLPALLEARSAELKSLADEIVKQWNEAFTRYTISSGTFAEIDGGFKRKLCYITTAVCESLGKSDDCYELKTLRDYRDNYLLSNEDGVRVVDTYYNIAPTIVNRIGKSGDSKNIYRNIFNEYINPCIDLIENGKLDECEKLYSEMVYSLKERYMDNRTERQDG